MTEDKEDKLAYYERRAGEEAEAVASATSVEAAVAHRALAAEYAEKARKLRARLGAEERNMPVEGTRPAGRRPKLSIK